ncbi:hypothetical protein EMPS_05753 [Entomortierella parvispora]|uniref:Steroid 5-alpha reductase C-terminal domain-containing protein n=1 Tax=Entomortierella parvispora TaxID=205924 RepID=A0A9P3HAZ6_9FUNG|nr:hypothetical protein EMPS_05753 [Entomortierella parvispora]
MVSTLAELFTWADYVQIFKVTYRTLSWPSFGDDSTVLFDIAIAHSRTDPLSFALRTSLVFSGICWFLSMATGTHSWVDRIWSLAPILYSIHFALRDKIYWPAGEDYVQFPRVYLATALIFIWGVRLTYNFYRKGGYGMDAEDYRWPYLGTKIHWLFWLPFNIIFICLFQNLLLVALTAPVYAAWRTIYADTVEPMNWIDAVATLLVVAGLALETVADQQQWKFQEAKKKAIAEKKTLEGDFKRGFLTKGLFRYSRHPNFFGEMTVWWGVYLYSVAAAYPTYNALINPTIVGPLCLTVLFQISTALTEHLTTTKYPAYKLYQSTTSRLIPMGAGASLDTLENKSK